ncbi:MAG: hypothetical protein U1G07_19680 [Verrucomicrobiota bacterium]
MSGKQAERRLRQRLKAWQAAQVPPQNAHHERASEMPGGPLRLEQRLEEDRTAFSVPFPSEAAYHLPTSIDVGVVFRAGQIWRRLDRQVEFIVDFSDGEQTEIRWFVNLQWGTPQILSVHDLLTYVRSQNLRTDWPTAALPK